MRQVNYAKIARPGSFIYEYMQQFTALETPHAYDFWSAVFTLSTAVGRRCVVARPRIPVFLNTYIILVAQSGRTRKSTSVRASDRVIRNLLPSSAVIDKRTSASMLERRLHELTFEHGDAQVAFMIPELVTLLGKELTSMALPGFLTDMYDCPDKRAGGGTLSSGVEPYRNVYFTILAASTPTWLVSSVHRDVIEGGFTSRCLFIIDDRRKGRIAWPSDDAVVDHNVTVRWLQDIRTTAERVKRITLTDGALRAYTNWYNTRPDHNDPFRASFEAREDDHALRLAALLSISDNRWVINDHDIRHATRVITEVKERSAAMFAGTLDGDDALRGIERVRTTLTAAGTSGAPIARLTAAARPFLSSVDVRSLLDIMHEGGLVRRYDVRTNSRGRRATVFVATSALSDRTSLSTLSSHFR